MKKYKEIFRLKEMLEKENIPFIFRNVFDGFLIEMFGLQELKI